VRKCGCGCGERLSGPAQKRFVDDAHRQRAGRRRLRSPRRRRRHADVGVASAVDQAPERVAEEPTWFDDDASGWESWSGR
jgi:hypothetical protein